MRISDWSSDVCSSDLFGVEDAGLREILQRVGLGRHGRNPGFKFSAEDFQRGLQRFHRTRRLRAERAPWPEQLGPMFEQAGLTGVPAARLVRSAERRVGIVGVRAF